MADRVLEKFSNWKAMMALTSARPLGHKFQSVSADSRTHGNFDGGMRTRS